MNPEWNAMFAHRVTFGPGCWIWNGSTNSRGYGKLRINSKSYGAHRISWAMVYGPIPKMAGFHGTCICHHCDVPLCVRPDHLFPGSNQDNARDMAAKGRALAQAHPERVARGDKNGSRTHPERLARGIKSGAYTHPEKVLKGESHGMSKMRLENVREIRRAYASGVYTQQEIANRFGIQKMQVSRIIRFKNWAHVL